LFVIRFSAAVAYDINWLYIIIPAAAVGALLILLLIVLCVRRSKRKNKNSSILMKGPYSCGVPLPNGAGTNIGRLAGGVGSQIGQQMEMNALLPPNSLVSTLQGQSTPSRIHVPEISLHAVRFQQDLGEGAFGKVRIEYDI
jgi:receptor tyrosine kinase-like orphan receptor 1